MERRAVDDFLAAAAIEPSALLIEGEPGIGKTTLWLAAVEQAKARGFRVLIARTAVAESVLAYTALADLLRRRRCRRMDRPARTPAARR